MPLEMTVGVQMVWVVTRVLVLTGLYVPMYPVCDEEREGVTSVPEFHHRCKSAHLGSDPVLTWSSLVRRPLLVGAVISPLHTAPVDLRIPLPSLALLFGRREMGGGVSTA